MTMQESVERYEKAGHAADHHWWDNDTAVKMLRSLLRRLEADPSARLCVRFGLKEDGSLTLWHYVSQQFKTLAECDDGLDVSHPCPPFC